MVRVEAYEHCGTCRDHGRGPADRGLALRGARTRGLLAHRGGRARGPARHRPPRGGRSHEARLSVPARAPHPALTTPVQYGVSATPAALSNTSDDRLLSFSAARA